MNMSALSTRNVEQYQARLINDDLKPASVNRILATLKNMVAKAVDWQMAPEDV